jgi:hypothetical protein
MCVVPYANNWLVWIIERMTLRRYFVARRSDFKQCVLIRRYGVV